MVTVNRVDKCLLCGREYIPQGAVIDDRYPTEYILIYCYKCVNRVKKENEIDIKLKTKSGKIFNFKAKKSNIKIKSELENE